MYIPFIIILTRHFQSQKKIQQKRTTTSLVTERKLKVLKVFFHMKKNTPFFSSIHRCHDSTGSDSTILNPLA